MYLLAFLFVFLLGTIIGSFLNVVIFRFNTGKSVAKGRSICMTCNNELRWFELIPVFSFLIQSGKCRRCAANISHQYPLVELVTGILFVLVALKYSPLIFISITHYLFFVVFFIFIFSFLIVISVYDLRHKIIPDKLVFIFIFLSFLSIFINHYTYGKLLIMPDVWSLLAGPILALPFVILWYFSKGHLMGLGDGKLILGIGWLLGISQGIFSLFVSFWIGTIVGLVLIIFSKANSGKLKSKVSMKTEIPFAPFLIIGLFVAFFLNLNFFSLVKFLSF